MPNRPQNECADCGYTWYPRGRDVSRRCPACGVVFTSVIPAAQAQPPLSRAAWIVVGVVCLLLLIGGIAVATREKADPQAATPEVKKTPETPPGQPDPKADPRPGKPDPVPKPGPATPVQTPPITGTSTPAVAPPPRPAHAFPPPPGWASDWYPAAALEIRIRSVAVAPVPLQDERRQPAGVSVPKLVIWVETRYAGPGERSMYPWQPAVGEYSFLTSQSGTRVIPAVFPFPLHLRGRDGARRVLRADQEPLLDTLTFEIPTAALSGLRLRLDLAQVSAKGDVLIPIPDDAWKK